MSDEKAWGEEGKHSSGSSLFVHKTSKFEIAPENAKNNAVL